MAGGFASARKRVVSTRRPGERVSAATKSSSTWTSVPPVSRAPVTNRGDAIGGLGVGAHQVTEDDLHVDLRLGLSAHRPGNPGCPIIRCHG